MKGYWDSSAILPLCLNAQNSQKIRLIWRINEERYAPWFMPVEVMSALARAERSGDITSGKRLVAENLFESLENKFIIIPFEDRIIEIARTLPAKYALTALDSLQLASALVWCKEYPRNKHFVTADARLSKAAESAGFTVHYLG